MNVLVVNHRRAGDVRLFAPLAGKLENSNIHTWKDADGQFSDEDGSLVCMYRHQGKLHLFFDGVTSAVDADLTTSVDTHRRSRRFRAFRSSELIYEKTYPRKPETDGNPFWPSEPEDEDFLLWVHNIVCSPKRQQILLTKAH